MLSRFADYKGSKAFNMSRMTQLPIFLYLIQKTPSSEMGSPIYWAFK